MGNMQSLESSAPVNCLDPVYSCAEDGTQTFVLYTGDEDGDVRAWDLSALLLATRIEPCKAKTDWDPRKKDQLDAAHTTMAVAKKALLPETPELPIKVDKQVVRQVRSWKAHGDSVSSLKVYTTPECIVTAGYDHMVKIWHMDGQMMTVLRAYGIVPWCFPVTADTIGLDEATLEKVRQTLRSDGEKEKAALAASAYAKKAQPRATLAVFSLGNEIKAHQARFHDQDEREKMQQRMKGPTL